MPQISRIDLEREVRNIVAQIPRGYVLTYGRIAELAGWPRHARLVGNIMRTQDDALLPCHRVVSVTGRLAPHYPAQAALLAAEGVTFTAAGRVNLSRHLWQPSDEESV